MVVGGSAGMPDSGVHTLGVLAYFRIRPWLSSRGTLVAYGWDGADAEWRVIARSGAVGAYGQVGVVLTLSTGSAVQRVTARFPVWVALPPHGRPTRVTLCRVDACSPEFLGHASLTGDTIPCWLTLAVCTDAGAYAHVSERPSPAAHVGSPQARPKPRSRRG